MEIGMIGMESRHCQIVTETLNGTRPADNQSLASMEILSQRLEKLQKLNKAFAKIELSSQAKELMKQKSALAVC
jgi:hypothetical protein